MTNFTGKRIAVGGFMHETNTFQPNKTTFADFAQPGDRSPLVRGAAILSHFDGMNQSIAGALQVLRQTGAKLLPLVWASTTPAGYVTEEAFERIMGMMLEDLQAALPLDAIYLNLHGAMVTEHLEDPEGEMLARIRKVVGVEIPIVASLDLHSNTTPQMFALSDALVAYCTYPHIDMADTGIKAARVLSEILVRGKRPVKFYRQLPYLIPLTWQCTTAEPSKSIYATLDKSISATVISISFTPGFPAADIYDCGAAVFAYGWDAQATQDVVERMYRLVLEAEPDYAGRLYSVDEAVQEAMRLSQVATKPVFLADTQDNPGAGGSADTVGLLEGLLRNRAQGAVLGVMHDPEVALAAHRAGPDATLTLGLGAKVGAFNEQPLDGPWKVERLGDGRMTCHGPMMTGWKLELGAMALLSCGGVQVVVSSKKIQAMDPEPFRHLGLDLRAARIVGVKSSVHFRAAFEPLAHAVLVVESPGAMIADPVKFPFKNLRPDLRMRPLGPTLNTKKG